jgi:hypothetical protein
MKATNNTVYSTDEYLKGKLISEDGQLTISNLREKQLKEGEIKDIIQLLTEGTNDDYQHICMSVYRDAFIFNGNIYNICLGCGDYYKNNEHHYLMPHATDELRTVLNYKDAY